MEHSCLFPDSTLQCWPLTKCATTLAKGIHSFKYFLPLWFFYSLCCYNMVTFVKNINSVTSSSSQCFNSCGIQTTERLACSALIPHLSPNSNELERSFHTNCFFRMIIQAINCKEVLLVYREIRPNEINTRSLLIRSAQPLHRIHAGAWTEWRQGSLNQYFLLETLMLRPTMTHVEWGPKHCVFRCME